MATKRKTKTFQWALEIQRYYSGQDNLRLTVTGIWQDVWGDSNIRLDAARYRIKEVDKAGLMPGNVTLITAANSGGNRQKGMVKRSRVGNFYYNRSPAGKDVCLNCPVSMCISEGGTIKPPGCPGEFSPATLYSVKAAAQEGVEIKWRIGAGYKTGVPPTPAE